MIRVRTGGRLHFGLIRVPPAEPWPERDEGVVPARYFGGAGLMIESPGVELTVEPAAEWLTSGPGAERKRRPDGWSDSVSILEFEAKDALNHTNLRRVELNVEPACPVSGFSSSRRNAKPASRRPCLKARAWRRPCSGLPYGFRRRWSRTDKRNYRSSSRSRVFQTATL